MKYEKDFLLDVYKKLVKERRLEERMTEEYAKGKLPGHIHSGVGEEAIFVGSYLTMRPKDWVKNTHRQIAAYHLKGVDIKTIFADCMGKATSSSKGHGGVNSISRPNCRIIGISGALGHDICIAVGTALSCKLQNEGAITYAFFGDGTSNRGPIHEAWNLASVWNLPILFIINNNQFAISTDIHRVMKLENIAERASGYGMPGRTVDGNDVLAVYETVKEMSDYVRAGCGPAVVECKGYRWRGHFEGDVCEYRSKDLTEDWKAKCCVKSFEEKLLEQHIINEELIKTIWADTEAELDEAVEYAENSPEPTIDTLYDGLFR